MLQLLRGNEILQPWRVFGSSVPAVQAASPQKQRGGNQETVWRRKAQTKAGGSQCKHNTNFSKSYTGMIHSYLFWNILVWNIEIFLFPEHCFAWEFRWNHPWPTGDFSIMHSCIPEWVNAGSFIESIVCWQIPEPPPNPVVGNWGGHMVICSFQSAFQLYIMIKHVFGRPMCLLHISRRLHTWSLAGWASSSQA